jgi:hypothetical protein
MSYYLFLDDERLPQDVTWEPIRRDSQYTIVRSFNEFVLCIASYGVPSYVTFDHDLGDEHYGHGLNDDEIPYDKYVKKTGYDCAKWLVNYCIDNNLKFPDYNVHSMNPVGFENILRYIETAKRVTEI